MSSAITYFIQMDGPGKLVKIGRSNKPAARLSGLQTGVPWPLRIVALFGCDRESELKRKFAEDRVQNEWFRPSQAMRDFLNESAAEGKLARQVPVDQAYINAAIKPRIHEYLSGREAANNPCGDLVRCVLADVLPTLTGRERELSNATKGHVTMALCYGFGPTTELPDLWLDGAQDDTATERQIA